MSLQLDIFDTLQCDKFTRYHSDNPAIYDLFKKFTFILIERGHKNYSADAILHRIRWHTMESGGDDYKINNNYQPFYARMFMTEYPQHEGFFRLRHSKADNQ